MTQATGVKFLFDNYISASVLANYLVSSEQASFPVENAFNFNRRGKVWRSNGYFNISSANNGLVFRKAVGGADLVASVAIAEYSSTATFLAALKAALEAADGVNTYTVTQDSNKKIVIASSGGTFEIRGADAGSTLVSTIGFAASNGYTGATSYAADVVRINTSEWILFDTGMASKPNAFAMTGPKSSGLKFSPASRIYLKGNPTNPVDWSAPAVSIELENDAETMAHLTVENFSTTGCRYWRLEFIDVDNAYGYLEVGAFFLGKWWSPAGGSSVFPLSVSRQDRSETIITEGGQSFSELKPKYQEVSVSYSFLNKDDDEDLEYYWGVYGTGKPFFVSLDTNEMFSSSFQKRILYCKFSGAPLQTDLYEPNTWSTKIALREEL